MPCPRESCGRARDPGPGSSEAQGELSESALMDPRTPNQTAIATAEIETDLDGQEPAGSSSTCAGRSRFSRKR